MYVLLANAQDQNDSIVSKYEIIPTRIVILLRIDFQIKYLWIITNWKIKRKLE